MSNFVGLDIYDRNDDRENKEGVEVVLAEGISIQILRAGGANKKYARTFSRVTAPYQRRMQSGKLDDDTSDKLMYEIYAESIVVSWTGIRVMGHDEDMPCTVENVVNLFTQQPDIFEVVREEANNMVAFRRQEIEEIVEPLGNS